MSAILSAAQVNLQDRRRWWHCPNCGQKLGEITGGRVVWRVGDRCGSFPATGEPEQTCPRCMTVSVLLDVC